MTDSRNEATSIALHTIEPQWKHAIRVWWSWQWRTFIAAFLLTTFVNFWIGALGGAVGLDAQGLSIAVQVVDLILTALVGLAFFRDILDRDFKTFKVCVVPNRTS